MGEIGAAGDIVTGALLGRAFEPNAGEGGGHDALCLNCGAALVGSHCHMCGQAAHVHRTLHSMGHDLLPVAANGKPKPAATAPVEFSTTAIQSASTSARTATSGITADVLGGVSDVLG